MIKPAHLLLPVVLIVGGCSSSVGPTGADLAGALQTSSPNIGALHCYSIPEEPTEFGCSYRKRDAAGEWVRQDVMIAIDGSTWVIIDGPGAPDQP